MLRDQYGYPICYSKPDKGYYYDLQKTWPISGLWFNADELQALLIIRQLLARLQPSLLDPYFNALAEYANKLLAATRQSALVVGKRINVIAIAHPLIASEIFLPLCRATLDNRVIKI